MPDDKCSEESRITRNEKDIQSIWEIIEIVRKGYLPIWACFLIAGLSSACTGLLVRAFA